MRAVGCTIVARNYLPYARVVAEGWRRFHGDAPFRVLVIDGRGDEGGAGDLDVVTPTSLGLTPGEVARLAGIYDVAELTTALKPHLLRTLLGSGGEAVIFLDSDHDVHADLNGAAALAARYGVVLSPHVLRPFPLDGASPSQLHLGVFGIFNSGFIAVGAAGRDFLDWWAERLRRDCLFAEDVGMHADQRWLDWVPTYFDHHILRDPGVNVGAWNLHERPLRRNGARYAVGPAPLRTFHFAGFDPERPDLLTSYPWPAPLRFDPAVEPDLRGLCRDYAGKLVAAGYREARRTPYGFGRSAAGTTLGLWERRVYREVVLAAEALGRDIPNPFDPARADEFERLIADPRDAGLLSEPALARLEDTRMVHHPAPGARLSPRRLSDEAHRWIARWRRRHRHPWMPHPLPSDVVAREYGVTAPTAPAVPGGLS